MATQIFTISETVTNKRDFALMLVDETDGKTPETGEAAGQPQIRKPGEITWTNTNGILIHVGNGHYLVALLASELSALGNFSVRYKSANTAEFQEVGHVQASGAVSLDSVNSLIKQVLTRVKYLEFIAKTSTQDAEQQGEFTVL